MILTRSELEVEIKQIKTRLTEIQTAIETDKRDFTPEERSEVDKLFLKLQDNRRGLKMLDEQEDTNASDEQFRTHLETLYATPEHRLTPAQEHHMQHRQAWYDYLLNGDQGMCAQSRETLSKVSRRKALDVTAATQAWNGHAQRALEDWGKFKEAGVVSEWGAIDPEKRDQLLVPDTAGGYLVPQGFSEELTEQLKYFGGMRQVSRIFPTATGNQIDWPTMDDTGAIATIVGEAAAIPELDITFGQKQLNAYKYVSGYVDVSWELLQDSFFNFEALLARSFATRFGRGTNLHYTNGNGTTQPQGITIATNNTLNLTVGGALSYIDVVNLKYSVNRTYRMMPGAMFMFSDEIEKRLMLLSTTEEMPLWSPSIRDGAPDTVLGIPYEINNDMSDDLTVGASKPPVMLYGQLSTYLIRDVAAMTMLRLQELKALNGLVTFLAFMRTDGEFMSAVDNIGDTPVKGLKPAAL